MAPERIVTLVPSLTELIWWLGAGDRLAGRTRFCVEPAGEIERVPVVGGTKNPDLSRIVELAPDLVVANKEENRREDVGALQAAGLDVLLTDPCSVAEAIALVRELGRLLDVEERAEQLAADSEAALAEFAPVRGTRVFVAIWKKPLMGLGGATYGHDLIERCGAINVLGGRARYPEVTMEDVRLLAPDLVLLPDEPYPFAGGDREIFAPFAPVHFVDGRLLWWYGPRMPAAIRGLRAVLAGVSAQ